MELFSILRFLQPFLQSSLDKSNGQNGREENRAQTTPNQENKTEKEKTAPSPPPMRSTQTAILGFYENHEKRAKRIRR